MVGPVAGRVIAIDPGTTFGWAVGSVEEDAGGYVNAGKGGRSRARFLIASGSERVNADKKFPGRRYEHLRMHLRDLFYIYGAAILYVYETPHQSGRLAAEYHFGMIATIQAEASRLPAEVLAVHSSTLKKYATGNGRAEKPDMLRAATRLVGPQYELSGHDEADAIWLCHYGRSEYLRTHPEVRKSLTDPRSDQFTGGRKA